MKIHEEHNFPIVFITRIDKMGIDNSFENRFSMKHIVPHLSNLLNFLSHILHGILTPICVIAIWEFKASFRLKILGQFLHLYWVLIIE